MSFVVACVGIASAAGNDEVLDASGEDKYITRLTLLSISGILYPFTCIKNWKESIQP